MMVPIKFLIKRIPCVKYEEEVYWIYTKEQEKDIVNRLKNDKNIVGCIRIS